MGNLDLRWALVFLAQLGTGLLLVSGKLAGGEALTTLGVGLIGGAFGQAATAQIKATKPAAGG